MMQPRVIPVLLLQGEGLVKTINFKNPQYIGDPRNAVRIFNEKEVDELVILDVTATVEHRKPKYDLINEIVSEAFMPVAYGGGINNIDDAYRLLSIGVEKIVLCTYPLINPRIISDAAERFGSQSIVICIDIKRGFWGKYEVHTYSGTKNTKIDPVSYAKNCAELGAGEIIINSIDRDGTMEGYDIKLIQMISNAVSIPVIACGGAGSVEDFRRAIKEGGASAVAAGSMFVFHGKHRAVLISYPDPVFLKNVLH